MNISTLAFCTYLAACIFLGGSAQGIWSNLILQLWGTGMIFWMIISPRLGLQTSYLRWLYMIVGLGVFWSLFQLLPLPTQIWSSLKGREIVVAGFELSGLPLPWMPISLQPDAAIGCLLALIPAFATFLLLQSKREVRMSLVAALIVGLTALSILLGIAQVHSGMNLYLYPFVNLHMATGFFANSNHLAALILVSIPFLFALLAYRGVTFANAGSNLVELMVFCVLGLLLVIGVVTNGSFAILLLGAPVLLASTLILIPTGGVKVGRLVLLSGAAAMVGVVALLATALSGLSQSNLTSLVVRQDIWTNSVDLLERFGWLGTGLGSFERVYSISEPAREVSRFYVNHAHNDYLELTIELGAIGLALIVAFLGWWIARTVKLWGMREPVPFARAATIASGALLLHSLVDFPLRTGALSAIFGLCLSLMVIGPRFWRSQSSMEKDVRHLTLADLH